MVVDLGKTMAAGVSRPSPETSGELPRLLPQIGRYTILDTLGRGGMGLVYKGYDAELDRRVAIKIFHHDRGGDKDSRSREIHARATREAQALAKLTHPNIVAVHEVGSFEGQVYIVMEYVRGETLREWLAARPPLKRVLEVFVQIGQALAAAHRAGIVHRDLKPENVVVRSDGQALVLDFGLARMTEVEVELDATGPSHSTGRQEGLHTSVTLTSPGDLIGTPAYMAPEQLLRDRACERSDQYSFCVCLHEALYGVRPFVSSTVDGLRLAVLAGEIRVVEQPVYPVPSYLRAAILRGLSFTREERFPHMDALVTVLVDGKWRRRVRGLLFAGVTAATLASASAGALWVAGARAEAQCEAQSGRAAALWSPDAQEAVRSRMLATGLGFAATGFERLRPDIDRFVAELGAASELVCARHDIEGSWDDETTARARECLAEAEWALAGLVSVLVVAGPSVVTRAAHAAGGLPRIDQCLRIDLLRERAPRAGDAGERARSAVLLAGLSRARSLLVTGQYGDVLALTEPLLQSARVDGEGRVVAEILLVQGLALLPRGELALAEQTLHAAATAAAAAGEEGLLVDALAAVAQVSAQAQRPEEGLRWGEMALALSERPGVGRLPRAQALRSVASVLRALGEREAAQERLVEAQALMEAELGAEHPEAVDVAVELARDEPVH